MSFSKGIFPDKLKIVKVIPLHKGGSTQDLNNFRPISLLSIFDKIIEKIIHKRLYHFLEHNILFENQFGFRKNNSTSYTLMEITERIESIDSGKFGCGIFIDLRKAFDTVNHDILYKKLEHYGVRGMLLEWFKSYLMDRKQYVFYNGESSDLKPISCGVPHHHHHHYHHHHHHHHHHSFNVSVPLKVGRTAPMFVLSFFLHSILFAGSALDSFQCEIIVDRIFPCLLRSSTSTLSNNFKFRVQY